MVRLKNRYLLVHILYPTATVTSSSSSNNPNNHNPSTTTIPPIVQFHQPTPSSLTAQLLTRTIRTEIATLYGDYGVGVTSTGLAVKYFSPATSTFILRVARQHYRLAWAALSFITKLQDSKECVLRVVRVSGTIRKAEQEAIRRARDVVLRARAAAAATADGGGEGLLLLRRMREGNGRGEVRVDDSSGGGDDEEEEEEGSEGGGGTGEGG